MSTAPSPSLCDPISRLREIFHAPDPSARPMMRWWWFGPDVRHEEIDRELRAMADAGLGGAEISVVYPLRETSTPYLSPPMLKAMRHAAQTARDLGLRLDVTLGSGWSFGGAHIGPDHAARCLRWDRRALGSEGIDLPVAGAFPGDELIVGYLAEGAEAEEWNRLDPDGATLRVPEGRGPRSLLLAWSRRTGQQVKRAAAGAEGPVMDHLSAAATRHHLESVGGRILGAVPAELIGSVFSDSLEVYGADWTPDLPEQFLRRRGEDLLDRMHLLATGGEGAGDLRADLGRTLSELVEEGFVGVCRDWSREHGVPFRLQGYGEPPITLSANRHVDLIEGEGCGWKSLPQTRWASSAGHLHGRPVSTEVWTWVHSPSFRATPMDLAGEAHEHLLLGSTHLVGHGWPYSPTDAPGIGWMFYASGALDDRNPWWPAMPELARSLTRLCALLREGRPVADVKILLPIDDVRAEVPAGAPAALDLWRACRDRIGPEIPAVIREGGWDLDLLDEGALEVLDPAEAPVVILPDLRRLPRGGSAWLDAVRAAGGTVISVADADDPMQEHSTVSAPGDSCSPGYAAAQAVTPEGLGDLLRSVIAPDLGIEGGDGDIGMVHRRLETVPGDEPEAPGDERGAGGDHGADLYLLANTGPQVCTVSLRPRTAADHAEIWDPRTGVMESADLSAVELHPYEAKVLVCWSHPAGRDAVETAPPSAQAPVIAEVPVELMDQGAGWYEATPDIDPAWIAEGTRIELDLGPCLPAPAPADAHGYRVEVEAPVREVAVVHVDEVECGVIWAAPHRLDLTGRLRADGCRLRLQVLGTAAAALAADPHAREVVAESRRHYGHRFQQQDHDRALEGFGEGLRPGAVLRVLGEAISPHIGGSDRALGHDSATPSPAVRRDAR